TTMGEGTRGTGDDVLDELVALGNDLPFNQHLGARVRSVGDGRATTVLASNEALTNHLGGVHAIAELAPVELAGAMAASSRLRPLVERGFVPVVGSLSVRYTAPASGELEAHARVDEGALTAALTAADAGEKPKVVAEVEVVDLDGTVVAEAQLTFLYLDVGGRTTPGEVI
ncbi:MAG: PaaI family thioesterase, partial [Nitriliruptoraceae bacterium]